MPTPSRIAVQVTVDARPERRIASWLVALGAAGVPPSLLRRFARSLTPT